jgi:hypothetical protein
LTPVEALRYRRALMERWATVSQEFREVRIATLAIMMPFLVLLFSPFSVFLEVLDNDRKNY